MASVTFLSRFFLSFLVISPENAIFTLSSLDVRSLDFRCFIQHVSSICQIVCARMNNNIFRLILNQII